MILDMFMFVLCAVHIFTCSHGSCYGERGWSGWGDRGGVGGGCWHSLNMHTCPLLRHVEIPWTCVILDATWRSLTLHTWWMPRWRSMDLHTCSMLRHVDVPWTCTAWLSCFLFRVILQMSFKTPITFFQDNSDFTFWTETKNTMAQRYWFQINHIQRQTFSHLYKMQWIARSWLSSVMSLFTRISKSQPKNAHFEKHFDL